MCSQGHGAVTKMTIQLYWTQSSSVHMVKEEKLSYFCNGHTWGFLLCLQSVFPWIIYTWRRPALLRQLPLWNGRNGGLALTYNLGLQAKRKTNFPLWYEARNNHYLAHIIQAVRVRFLRCDVMIELAGCYATRTDGHRPRVYRLIFRRLILPFGGFHVHQMGSLSAVIERFSIYLTYIHLIDLVEMTANFFAMWYKSFNSICPLARHVWLLNPHARMLNHVWKWL